MQAAKIPAHDDPIQAAKDALHQPLEDAMEFLQGKQTQRINVHNSLLGQSLLQTHKDMSAIYLWLCLDYHWANHPFKHCILAWQPWETYPDF